MSKSTKESWGITVRAFLRPPLDRSAFTAFFELCHFHTCGYLRYLKATGFALPLNLQADGDPLSDLAYDILGTLLASPKGSVYPVVFDYFAKVSPDDPSNADASGVYFYRITAGDFTDSKKMLLLK